MPARMESGNSVLGSVRLVRHPRARRLRLRVDLTNGEAVLVMPPYASRREAMDFLSRHGAWLEAQQARLEPVVPFAPGVMLDIFGCPIVLQHVPRQRGGAVWTGEALVCGGALAHFSRRVQSAVRARALAQFTEMATAFSAQLGLQAARVQLRDTRSRWGSCTADGRIQLSWRLAFAPPEVARYVVAHEVAHRREMNHSPRFWRLVGQLVGDHRAEQAWLSAEGYKLLRLGVADLRQPRELQADTVVLRSVSS